MGHVPVRSAVAADPETLHVQNAARIDDQLAVVALRHRARGVAEEHRRRLLHCSKKRRPTQNEKKNTVKLGSATQNAMKNLTRNAGKKNSVKHSKRL